MWPVELELTEWTLGAGAVRARCGSERRADMRVAKNSMFGLRREQSCWVGPVVVEIVRPNTLC